MIRTPCATRGVCRAAVRLRGVVATRAIDPRSGLARPRGDIVRRARRKPGWPDREGFPATLRRPSRRRASPRWCPCWRRSPCRRACMSVSTKSIDDGRRSRVQYGGGHLPLGVPDAVAEFRGSRGQVDTSRRAAVTGGLPSGVRWAGRSPAHGWRPRLPSSHSSPSGLGSPRPLARACSTKSRH